MPTAKEIQERITGKPAEVETTEAAPEVAPAEAEKPKATRGRKPKVEKPAAPVEMEFEADEEDGKVFTFSVELKDNPKKIVEARDRMEAVEKYKEACGIISTVHEFKVRKAK